MDVFSIQPSTATLVLACIVVLGLGIWSLYPKPIPGIPYNEEARGKLFGDLSTGLKEIKRTGGVFDWIASNFTRHNSPIVQVWLKPFSKPWVAIADHEESLDICVRRTKEIDRSEVFMNFFHALAPEAHGRHLTADPRFRHQRNLLRDTMSVAFLSEVAAPVISMSAEQLVSLWTARSYRSKLHPTDLSADIDHLLLDVITGATFGLDQEDCITYVQNRFVNGLHQVQVSDQVEEPVDAPLAPLPAWSKALLDLTETQAIVTTSPVPLFHHWVVRQLPWFRKAYATKERQIDVQVDAAIQRLESGNTVEKSAIDNIVRREKLLASKEGRTPEYKSRVIYDELMTFLVAGHDTTATTMKWGLKFLTRNQAAQSRLREELKSAFPRALIERRTPSAKELTSNVLPYLEATVEEILRLCKIVPAFMRDTLTDCTVMGHHIPKGTTLILFAQGPGFTDPYLGGNSPSTVADSKYKYGQWNQQDVHEFKPERWLKPASSTEGGRDGVVFDPLAGPMLTFGAGPRGCFGRKLAYLSLKTIVTHIVWNFELLPIPSKLDTWTSEHKIVRTPRDVYVRLRKLDLTS